MILSGANKLTHTCLAARANACTSRWRGGKCARKNGKTNGLNGKLVTSCSVWWNSSTLNDELWGIK